MDTINDYLKINRQTWNEKTDIHINSEFYDMNGFKDGKSSLNEIELKLLGDISGKSILHLQCHFGQDTMSLSRLGADVTGVDFSEKAIENAVKIAKELNINAKFVCSDIYSLPQNLNEKFDIIFTSYGVIGWLPNLTKWAEVISQFLKPGGTFILAEFHPVVWMYDDNFEKIIYSYFNVEPIIETETGSYADRKADKTTTCVVWNHSLSEVISSLIGQGLAITDFEEHDYSPYNCFNNTAEISPGKYVISHFGNKIPMVFAIKGVNQKSAMLPEFI